MAEHGLGTYYAQQKKFISQNSITKRQLWGFDRRYWSLDNFKPYNFTDECHFACGLQRKARIHRRPGQKARDAPEKIQFRFKRRNQCLHVFRMIGYNYKGPLHFYIGAGGTGRLTQKDYITILEEIVHPNWDSEWILLEDNDNAHGTRGDGDNKVKQAKQRLGIKWEANPPESPNLNPIKSIWRLIKQRLKNRGLILDPADLRTAIVQEWDKVTVEEINKAVSSMPNRVKATQEQDGLPISF